MRFDINAYSPARGKSTSALRFISRTKKAEITDAKPSMWVWLQYRLYSIVYATNTKIGISLNGIGGRLKLVSSPIGRCFSQPVILKVQQLGKLCLKFDFYLVERSALLAQRYNFHANVG